jgi:hypothetical protein
LDVPPDSANEFGKQRRCPLGSQDFLRLAIAFPLRLDELPPLVGQ